MLDRVLFLGRQAEDVLDCFNLDFKTLSGRSVLDCPAGPSSFCSMSRSHGVPCTAIDPCYALSLNDLQIHLDNDISEYSRRARAGIASQRSGFDVERFICDLISASEKFLEDFTNHPSHYLAASLPSLPLEAQSFDLVISGHLLFIYSPQIDGGILEQSDFDLQWHQQALAELLRIARQEVRIFPVHAFDANCNLHPYLNRLLDGLPPGWMSHVTKSRFDQGHDASADLLILSRC